VWSPPPPDDSHTAPPTSAFVRHGPFPQNGMLFRFVEYPLLSNRWNICPAALQSASQIHLEWPKIVFPIIISQRKRKVKNLRQYRKWKDLRGGTSGRKGGVEAKGAIRPVEAPKKRTIQKMAAPERRRWEATRL